MAFFASDERMTQLTVAQAFARRLRRERWLMAAEKDREIENQEVAEALGVEPSTAGRWFDGTSMPREDTLARLAAYFGVTPAWLRYGQEPRLAPPVGVPKETLERPARSSEAAGKRGSRPRGNAGRTGTGR
jgi:transcriptional regulator with XRE-family HTH domain